MSVRKYLRILCSVAMIILGTVLLLIGIADLREYYTGNNFIRNFLGLNRNNYVLLHKNVNILIGILVIFSFFVRKKKEKAPEYDNDNLPKFKYHKDPLKTGAFVMNTEKASCSCCDRLSKYIYTKPVYLAGDLTCLCPECIITGEAHEQLKVLFHNPDNLIDVVNKDAIEEVCMRTPGYRSWQDEKWLACCSDLCVYLGSLTWEDVIKLKLESLMKDKITENEDFKALNLTIEKAINLINKGDIDLVVFKCLHCEEYKIDLNIK